MTNDLEAIQAWLQSSYSVLVPPDWLSACVEWIQEENGGQPMSAERLQPMVFEQWLLSDLKELGAACLPPELPSQPCTEISGPLALQVESMLDVGVPLYGQLQKVKGTVNSNSEVSADKPQQPAWEPKPSRMMLLKMTDGQTQVQGMEYRPIPAFNADLQPGFKMVVHGQVKCRRGVLLLTADNVQVLGGEVDSLIESNTPAAILERAMELNTKNNGKHVKKEFSGRFIKKQDFKQGFSDQKCKKIEMTSTVTRPASWSGNQGHQASAVKKEPLTQQKAVEDEWEEDLDYGGLLNSLDEPMEEESRSISSESAVPQNNPAALQVPEKPQRSNPFACHASAASAKPRTSWQSFNSFPHSSSVKSETSVRTKQESSFRNNENCSAVLQEREQVDSFEVTNGQGRGKQLEEASSQKSSVAVLDDMWEDDDDFDMAQMEANFPSPVIPVQIPLGDGSCDKKTTTDCDSLKQGGVKISNSQKGHHSLSANTSEPKLQTNLPNAVRPKIGTNYNSSVDDASKKSNTVKSSLQGKSSFSSRQQSSFLTSSTETKPPPPKQRKLTAMFSRTKMENNSATSVSCSQSFSDSVIDLTDCDASSTHSSTDFGTVEQNAKSLKQEHKDDGVRTGSSSKVPSPAKNEGYQDVHMVEKPEDDCSVLAPTSTLNENSPRAVVPPFSCKGDSGSPGPEPQTLKSVQTLVMSSLEEENTCTVKGYITTLTDRLRSCQGDAWSLSCRITDGTATVEVAIADVVLSQLIGFTAKESITLRQKARNDSSVKDFLTKGLQKCQKTLIEFSGLMDIETQKGSAKPVLVRMVQLETKIR